MLLSQMDNLSDKSTRLAIYVEDNVDFLLLMQELFPVDGLQLVTYPNSEKFMEKLALLPVIPELFLLDIHVPPLDGFELLASLRKHPSYKKVPTVALTASVMNEEVARLKRAGFNAVLAKPLDVDTFENSIRRILRGEYIWQIGIR